MPGRVRRDLPGGLRRFQLLPVPQPRLLARALRGRARIAPVRLQGPRGDHRRSLAGSCAVRDAGRTVQRIVPRCRAVRAPVRRPAGAVPGPGGHPHLRVRDDPAERLRDGRGVRRTARRLPRRPAGRVSLRRRGSQPRLSRARATSPRWRATASRTCSMHGLGCRRSPPRPRWPGRSRPISRSSAPCSAPAGPTSKPSPASRRIAPSASPTRPRATPSSQIAGRARQSGQPAYRVRQQPARRQCPVHHRSRRRGPRTPAGERERLSFDVAAGPSSPARFRVRPLAAEPGPDRMIAFIPHQTPRRPCARPWAGVAFLSARVGKALQCGIVLDICRKFHGLFAGVAQSAEHRFCKPRVVSSSLTASSARCGWRRGRERPRRPADTRAHRERWDAIGTRVDTQAAKGARL